MSGLLSEQSFFVIHELHPLLVIHVREQRPSEVVVVTPANVGTVELLGDGNAVVETDLRPDRRHLDQNQIHYSSSQVTEARSRFTHLLQEVSEGAEVDGVGVAERAVDVEQDGLQRRQLRQGAAASELRGHRDTG